MRVGPAGTGLRSQVRRKLALLVRDVWVRLALEECLRCAVQTPESGKSPTAELGHQGKGLKSRRWGHRRGMCCHRGVGRADEGDDVTQRWLTGKGGSRADEGARSRCCHTGTAHMLSHKGGSHVIPNGCSDGQRIREAVGGMASEAWQTMPCAFHFCCGGRGRCRREAARGRWRPEAVVKTGRPEAVANGAARGRRGRPEAVAKNGAARGRRRPEAVVKTGRPKAVAKMVGTRPWPGQRNGGDKTAGAPGAGAHSSAFSYRSRLSACHLRPSSLSSHRATPARTLDAARGRAAVRGSSLRRGWGWTRPPAVTPARA